MTRPVKQLEIKLQSGCDQLIEMYQSAREEITDGITRNLEKEALRQHSPLVSEDSEKVKSCK